MLLPVMVEAALLWMARKVVVPPAKLTSPFLDTTGTE